LADSFEFAIDISAEERKGFGVIKSMFWREMFYLTTLIIADILYSAGGRYITCEYGFLVE